MSGQSPGAASQFLLKKRKWENDNNNNNNSNNNNNILKHKSELPLLRVSPVLEFDGPVINSAAIKRPRVIEQQHHQQQLQQQLNNNKNNNRHNNNKLTQENEDDETASSSGRDSGSSDDDAFFGDICDENLHDLVHAVRHTLFPRGLGIALCPDSGQSLHQARLGEMTSSNNNNSAQPQLLPLPHSNSSTAPIIATPPPPPLQASPAVASNILPPIAQVLARPSQYITTRSPSDRIDDAANSSAASILAPPRRPSLLEFDFSKKMVAQSPTFIDGMPPPMVPVPLAQPFTRLNDLSHADDDDDDDDDAEEDEDDDGGMMDGMPPRPRCIGAMMDGMMDGMPPMPRRMYPPRPTPPTTSFQSPLSENRGHR